MIPRIFSMAMQHKRPGAAVLILVLVLGAVSIAIGASIALGSIGEISMGYSDVQSKITLSLTDSCAEEALIELRSSLSYAGATLVYSEGSCIITVTNNGALKQIDIVATAGRWTERAVLQVDVSGSRLAITDWKRN